MKPLFSLRGAAFTLGLSVALGLSLAPAAAQGVIPQTAPTEPVKPRRIHLILKDGTFQIVTSYKVAGQVVQYTSAERGGETEEIPLALVDLNATQRWEKAHTQAAPADSTGDQTAPHQAPPIDPELLAEEQERANRTPLVAPDLRLPEQDSALALDTFQGAPELVPLQQSAGDLNRTTSHNILRQALSPVAAQHQLLTLKGTRSFIQMHVDQPVFYLRVGDETPTGGTPYTVDTHGASQSSAAKSTQTGGSPTSRYVIVRADVRTDARVLSSFRTSALSGDTRRDEDVVPTHAELLPGSHWMKLTPDQPLPFGEYALMEVISDNAVNLSVWDFGVHPTAPENRDVLHPDPRHTGPLTHHKPE
jgi:hypothetical protein